VGHEDDAMSEDSATPTSGRVDDRPHRIVWVVLSLALAGAIYGFAPLDDSSLGPDPHRVRIGLAILVLTGGLWLTEALPLAVTALLVPVLASFGGALNVGEAFASFAHPLIFLFLAGFGLAAGLSRHGLDAWLANRVLRLVGGGFRASSFALFGVSAGLSMWISNTATVALLLPVSLGLLRQVERVADRDAAREATPFLLLGVAYSASVGGIGTLVGSPPNAIAAAALGLTFRDWLVFGMPFVAVLLPALFVALPLLARPGPVPRLRIDETPISLDAARLGTLAIFGLTVLGWLFARPLADALGIATHLDSVIGIAGVVAMATFGLVGWQDIDRTTSWGVLLLFGGGLTLSRVLEATGASAFLAGRLADLTSGLPTFGLLVIVVLFLIFLTELSSNTATAALFVPIFLDLAGELDVPPVQLVIPVAVACSCAFMLPVATPPNAIVFGSGRIEQRTMVRVGLVLNLVCTLLITGLAAILL
jgi:sodium-dependent dicarboxylate transporter 2/3/5